MFVIAVTGWRQWTDAVFVEDRLAFVTLNTPDDYTFRFGDAQGVDDITWKWCERQGFPYVRWNAQWNVHGRDTGPQRNKFLLTEPTKADILLGFPEPGVFPKIPGSGSWNCIGQAFELGIDVMIPAYMKGK